MLDEIPLIFYLSGRQEKERDTIFLPTDNGNTYKVTLKNAMSKSIVFHRHSTFVVDLSSFGFNETEFRNLRVRSRFIEGRRETDKRQIHLFWQFSSEETLPGEEKELLTFGNLDLSNPPPSAQVEMAISYEEIGVKSGPDLEGRYEL
ncbi:hypothetical protein [Paenibacillus polymyxa]|uniref:hypothetical protein n=1 Tax=Paenibacillus polymyxa TaxID=1406 RepID=UPI002348FBCF|nr:hypothetical protein [Paenibacillus polymyxa]WCM63784.1 hypothetical protein OYT09_13025 [Paenibacillus polymyxa]